MSESDIKINFEEYDAELKRLNKAINEFEPYSKDFIKKTKNKFDGFRSDFIDKMNDLLENMADSKSPKLVEEAKEFYKLVKGLSDTFQELDNEVAKKFENK